MCLILIDFHDLSEYFLYYCRKNSVNNPKTGRTRQKGAQIDLLIDRNDDTINLCEMKYSNAPYVITEEEDMKIRSRKAAFIRETGTEKTVLITMITSYGLAPGGYSDDIQCQLTMSDLFR